ncbi:MAG: hypothetical protein P8Y71_18815 [Pseudolabrys sp.]
MRDRIEADLVRHLERVESTLLATVVRQAGLARDIAAGIARFIAEQQAHRPFDRAAPPPPPASRSAASHSIRQAPSAWRKTASR